MDYNSKDFIKQRSFEISWAVFRVAALVRRPKLKTELESAAVGLISQYIDLRSQYIEKLEGLVKLAEKIGEIKPINASVLYRELSNLQTAIVSGKRQTAIPDVEIESIFSKPPMIIDKNTSINTSINTSNNFKQQAANGNLDVNGKRQAASSERKAIILRNIQESSKNLQFKDLTAILSGISERTVRNDIQQLCDEGIIERIGGGGPYSYYRLATRG